MYSVQCLYTKQIVICHTTNMLLSNTNVYICTYVYATKLALTMLSKFCLIVRWCGGTVLLVRHQTCDMQLVGLSPGGASLHINPGQATYTCVPLSPSSIIWYQPRGVISLAGKVTTGLVESDDSLRLGLWLMSPVGWLPRNQDQLRAQHSKSSMGLL